VPGWRKGEAILGCLETLPSRGLVQVRMLRECSVRVDVVDGGGWRGGQMGRDGRQSGQGLKAERYHRATENSVPAWKGARVTRHPLLLECIPRTHTR
jgi:hypothetical protein